MAPAPEKPWTAAVIVAGSVLKLVAELRYYLGGENYSSGRYAGTHSMLFAVEEHLRAMDLDGAGMLVRGDGLTSLPASEVMLYLCRATERLSELVDSMKAAAERAGAGGRNGGSAADAQDAVASWLAAGDGVRLLQLMLAVTNLLDVCYDGKDVLDDDAARRRRKAELEQLRGELAAPPESAERAGAGDASARKGRLRIRRLLQCFTRNRRSKLRDARDCPNCQ